MANPITNKVKTGRIPVIKKDLEDGVIAEANNDGTIFLDKKVKNNSPLAKEAIAHEMVHMDQMARGDLDYNDNNVIWKGKKYSREQMNEGSKNLPWEKEAYKKTENMKKSPAKLSLSQGALETNANVIVGDLKAKAGKRGAIVGAVDNVLGEVKGFDAFSKSTGSGKKGTNPNPEEEKNSGATMNYKNKNKGPFKLTKKNPSVRDAVGNADMTGKQGDFDNEYKSTEDFIGSFRGDDLKGIVKHEGADTPEKRAKAYKTLGSGKQGNKYDGWQTEERVVTDYDTAYKDRNRDTYGDMSKKEYIEEAKRQKKSFIDKGDFDAPAKMKSTPITKKSKYGGSSSPLHVETKSTEEFKNVTIDDSDDVGTLTVNKTTTSGNDFDDSGEKMSDEDYIQWKKDNPDWKEKEAAYVEKVEGSKPTTIFDSAFTPNEIKSQEKGTPGTPDKKNMGYYESMDAKWGAGVRNRGNKKVNRIANRAGRKFDRGKAGLNPETGEAWASKAEYVKAQAAAAKGNYDTGVGKVKLGEKGTADGPETVSNQQSDGSQTKMVKQPDGSYKEVVVETEKSSSNKMKKSAFKMKGWSAY